MAVCVGRPAHRGRGTRDARAHVPRATCHDLARVPGAMSGTRVTRRFIVGVLRWLGRTLGTLMAMHVTHVQAGYNAQRPGVYETRRSCAGVLKLPCHANSQIK